MDGTILSFITAGTTGTSKRSVPRSVRTVWMGQSCYLLLLEQLALPNLQALNQIIEKSNEYNLPLCIGFIDYEKAFDTVEHFAIFEALRKTNVNETYINILQNIYNQATARVHLDKLVSTEFQIHRGVRQGDPLSPKLFTAVMEEVFKKAEISGGVNVDGENLSNLRFADDVALLNETSKQMEKHMNNLNSESMKVGLKIHKGKTKYMTNYADNEDILIGQQKIEKVTEFKYLGQTTHLKDTTKEEIYARIRAGWSCFGKNKEILQDKQLPISLKKQVMDQCILPTMTYGCQTWSLNKQMTNKLRTAQRAMERKMLDLKLKDKIPCAEIRKRTKIIDIIEYTLKQKWKWAGHIARLKEDNPVIYYCWNNWHFQKKCPPLCENCMDGTILLFITAGTTGTSKRSVPRSVRTVWMGQSCYLLLLKKLTLPDTSHYLSQGR